MSFEVEQKFRTTDHEAVSKRLLELGAKAGEPLEQEDDYLSHPSRDFAVTGEAFRLRRAGDRNAITYKGPKLEGPTKTRREIEIEFASGAESLAQMRTLFECLGFRPVAIVRKVRTPYHLSYGGREFEVALDQVEGLGTFVEVETIVKGDDELPKAQEAVVGLARELGLTEPEPRSYLKMVLERSAPAPAS
jgi:adenylate cyclase class 2